MNKSSLLLTIFVAIATTLTYGEVVYAHSDNAVMCIDSSSGLGSIVGCGDGAYGYGCVVTSIVASCSPAGYAPNSLPSCAVRSSSCLPPSLYDPGTAGISSGVCSSNSFNLGNGITDLTWNSDYLNVITDVVWSYPRVPTVASLTPPPSVGQYLSHSDKLNCLAPIFPISAPTTTTTTTTTTPAPVSIPIVDSGCYDWCSTSSPNSYSSYPQNSALITTCASIAQLVQSRYFGVTGKTCLTTNSTSGFPSGNCGVSCSDKAGYNCGISCSVPLYSTALHASDINPPALYTSTSQCYNWCTSPGFSSFHREPITAGDVISCYNKAVANGYQFFGISSSTCVMNSNVQGMVNDPICSSSPCSTGPGICGSGCSLTMFSVLPVTTTTGASVATTSAATTSAASPTSTTSTVPTTTAAATTTSTVAVTTTVTSTNTGPYILKGCYDWCNRPTPDPYTHYPGSSASIVSCISTALSTRAVYFGVAWSTCLTVDDVTQLTAISSSCDFSCDDGVGYKCGKQCSVPLYATGNLPTTNVPPKTAPPQGYYAGSYDWCRSPSLAAVTRSGIARYSYNQCLDIAVRAGSTYFGISSQTCILLADYTDLSADVTHSLAPCTDVASKSCGYDCSLTVYSSGILTSSAAVTKSAAANEDAMDSGLGNTNGSSFLTPGVIGGIGTVGGFVVLGAIVAGVVIRRRRSKASNPLSNNASNNKPDITKV